MRIQADYRAGMPKEIIIGKHGVDPKVLRIWVRDGKWNMWRFVDSMERKWKDRLRANLEVMSQLAVDLIGGIEPDQIRTAKIGDRIFALKLITDSMEKSAKMLGETPDAGASQPDAPMIMERGKAIEVLTAMGYRPPCGLPAPIDAISIGSGQENPATGLEIDSRGNREGASDDDLHEMP